MLQLAIEINGPSMEGSMVTIFSLLSGSTLLLRTEMSSFRVDKMRPLCQEVIVAFLVEECEIWILYIDTPLVCVGQVIWTPQPFDNFSKTQKNAPFHKR